MPFFDKKEKGSEIMAEKRKDNKGRILRTGEYYDAKNNRYMFRKMVDGERITFTADNLTELRKQENELLEKPDLVYKIIHNDGEYELEGWYFGEIKWDFDTMTVEGDMVLKARWNKIEDYPKPEI